MRSLLLVILGALAIVHFFSAVALLQIVALVLLFGLTIFVHELGHFLTALATGMKVDAFSLGFGPAIWQKTFRGVTYKISWFPVGGYVAIPQLDPSGMETLQGKDGDATEKKEVRELPPVAVWKRIVVAVAGSASNVVLAIVLAWIIYLHPGAVTEEGNTVIGAVEPDSAAYAAGVQPGDKIVSVDGEKVRAWGDVALLCVLAGGKNGEATLGIRGAKDDVVRNVTLPTKKSELGFQEIGGISKSSLSIILSVTSNSPAERAGFKPEDIIKSVNGVAVNSPKHFASMVAEQEGKPLSVNVIRGGAELALMVTPRFDEKLGRAIVGIHQDSLFGTPWMQFKKPMDQIKGDALPIFRFLKALVTPSESRHAAKGLGGPPMIMVSLWFSIQISLLNAVAFIRFLNINLAIINMLPLPVLDGGHVVFALWEGITRQKPSPRFINALVNTFAVLLIGLMVFLSVRDVPMILKMFGVDKKAKAEEVAAGTNAVESSRVEVPEEGTFAKETP